MKVILMQDVDKIGKIGQVVDVKMGYATNFLIPKGLAKVSNEANMRLVEGIKLKAQRMAEKEKKQSQEFSDKLAGISCTVTMQVGPDGKFYGSVTPADIQKALESEGIQVDKKAISIEEPIEKLGVYHVSIRVHPEVQAKVKVWVVENKGA
jgi:large subunit ribosomal protein L9